MKNKNNDLFTLDKFIEESLYNKKSGYYMKKNPFGEKGDFITAPNISVLFSEMIAIWVISFGEKPQPRQKNFNKSPPILDKTRRAKVYYCFYNKCISTTHKMLFIFFVFLFVLIISLNKRPLQLFLFCVLNF